MAESTGKFEEAFQRVLEEDMTAAGVGVAGTGDGFSPNNSIANNDGAYAEGENKMAFPLFGKGKVQKRSKPETIGGKRKKKKKVKKKKPYLPGENEEGEERDV
jgi:hypothetical protein